MSGPSGHLAGFRRHPDHCRSHRQGHHRCHHRCRQLHHQGRLEHQPLQNIKGVISFKLGT